MEPLLIDKIINRIEKRGGKATFREIATMREELDRIVCENISLRITGHMPGDRAVQM